MCHNFLLLGIEAVELAHSVEVIFREPLGLRKCRLQVQAHLIDDPIAPNTRPHNLADVVPEVPVELQHGSIDLQMRLDLALAIAALDALDPLQILRIKLRFSSSLQGIARASTALLLLRSSVSAHLRIARYELIRHHLLIHRSTYLNIRPPSAMLIC